MRIIGGQFRGRKIKQPELETTRPTKDRIREAVFNIIAVRVPGSKVLDIFAGSGAYGLEALSRGAEEAVFVEKNKVCSGVLNENIQVLGVTDDSEVIAADFFEIGGTLKEKGPFDLVFLDPPYSKNLAKKALIMINQYDILGHSGLLIIEHSSEESLPGKEGGISLVKQKTYKKICISIFLKK
ncbi:MAG: 16S rRNA (guanine(966)-N(2))-methyltransferase RsmD [Candidatus Omnitrophica bacterium]|nr:16S rRNA (guanine(966)-N(2))-methyltransferase RsmD [Candidatus Omnitrophota bacterium]